MVFVYVHQDIILINKISVNNVKVNVIHANTYLVIVSLAVQIEQILQNVIV